MPSRFNATKGANKRVLVDHLVVYCMRAPPRSIIWARVRIGSSRSLKTPADDVDEDDEEAEGAADDEEEAAAAALVLSPSRANSFTFLLPTETKLTLSLWDGKES